MIQMSPNEIWNQESTPKINCSVFIVLEETEEERRIRSFWRFALDPGDLVSSPRPRGTGARWAPPGGGVWSPLGTWHLRGVQPSGLRPSRNRPLDCGHCRRTPSPCVFYLQWPYPPGYFMSFFPPAVIDLSNCPWKLQQRLRVYRIENKDIKMSMEKTTKKKSG